MSNFGDFSRVPSALRKKPQWLVWRSEQKDGDPKPRKVPYYAGGGRRVGTQGDDADRKRLVSFDRAFESAASGRYSGLGFAFLPGDGLIGIDLDNCIDADTGEITERAAGIIRGCGSYTEFSPSGKGVHIYSFGQTKSHKSNEIGVEMFCGRQFFTVTGKPYPGTVDEVTPIRAEVIERLHKVIDEARGKHRAHGSASPERQPAEGEGGLEQQSFFARVNSKALHNLSAWVPALLPKARPYQDGFRISSADLGRDLQEDLSMLPAGITDWGTERGKTAIDLVLEWGAPTSALDAAQWLCARLGIDPQTIGGKRKRTSSASTQRGAAQGGKAPPKPPSAPAGDDDLPFRTNRDGKIQPSLYNTLVVLEHDPAWRDVLGFNLFSYRITKRRAPPVQPATEGEWVDADDVRLQVYLTKVYEFEPKKVTVMDAVMQQAHQAQFHPVREYLEGLRWDGKPRLAGMLGEYWGATSTPSTASLRREDPAALRRRLRYLELAGTKWLVGAVARIFEPGCKLDTMLVFEGGQGDFKSTSIRALFGAEWFSDSKMTIGDKDALAQMQGKWAYEMAEMDAHRKADDTAFKQFITTQVDRVRWHYGKRAEDVPRQCIFVGTTNMDQYGKDETGMRRIWPIDVGFVDVHAIREARDQLWAEAVHRYRASTTWWVDKFTVGYDVEGDDPLSEWELFEEQCESRQIVDAWETPILDWIDQHNALPYFTTAEIMGDALKLDRARWTPPEQKRVSAIMRRLGYRSKKVGPKHSRVNGWVKIADEADEEPDVRVPEVEDVPL